MIHRCFLLFMFSMLFMPVMHSQDTVKTREVVSRFPDFEERYFVKQADSNVWHGKFVYTYKGKVMMEGAYYNDRMDGEWKYYYRSGALKFDVFYSKGVFQKTKAAFYESGKTLCTDSILGKKEIIKFYSEQSELIRESIFFNGLKVQTTYYYPHSGQKKTLMTGEQDSVYHVTQYYENGKIRSEVQAKAGIPYTVLGCYDIQGNSLDQGNLKLGTGTLKTYQDTTPVLLQSQVEFKNGKKNGLAIYFQFNGNPGKRGVYQNDTCVGKWVFFTKAGHLDFTWDYSPKAKNFKEKMPVLPSDKVQFTGNLGYEFAGGEEELYAYLKKAIVFPGHSHEKDYWGYIVIRFEINTDGIAEHIAVLKGVESDISFEKAIIKMVEGMPRWMPSFMDGKLVKGLYIISVNLNR
ncbi:MAG TPA: hypothetical protein VNZ86_20605 [Bacteroidia bacterium]|jgi:antitoxin component YwqK of YwqJK toxin-antitoxin module|nr:hypothetical protein [Bacteroidia bacterium]